MILISYDGSHDSQAAIERAAELFPGQPATVLTVWQPFAEVVSRTVVGFGLVPSVPDASEIDDASQRAAEKTADEGRGLAAQRGLTAEARIAAQATTIARTVLAEADRLGADAIVMGTRGLTGLKSLLLGSVSNELVQHADRAVVVVPSQELAAARRGGNQPQTAG
jgi:nucleotide-binding universal stress UspA family protein